MQNVPAGELHTRLPNAVAAVAVIVCIALSRKLRPKALYDIYEYKHTKSIYI